MKIAMTTTFIAMITIPALAQEEERFSLEQRMLLEENERCAVELATLQHVIPTERIEECAGIHQQVSEMLETFGE